MRRRRHLHPGLAQSRGKRHADFLPRRSSCYVSGGCYMRRRLRPRWRRGLVRRSGRGRSRRLGPSRRLGYHPRRGWRHYGWSRWLYTWRLDWPRRLDYDVGRSHVWRNLPSTALNYTRNILWARCWSWARGCVLAWGRPRFLNYAGRLRLRPRRRGLGGGLPSLFLLLFLPLLLRQLKRVVSNVHHAEHSSTNWRRVSRRIGFPKRFLPGHMFPGSH